MAGEPIVTIVGNLTADPDLRFLQSGQAVANFTVASTPRTKNQQTGQWEDGEAMFVRCSIWREYAENVAETLAKGMRVIAQGRLTVRSYQDNQGQARQSIEMQVDEIGPSLRYATAQVARIQRENAHTAPQTTKGRSTYGRTSFGAPQGGTANDPWTLPGPTPTEPNDAPPF